MAFCCCGDGDLWYICQQYPYKETVCLDEDPPCCPTSPPWQPAPSIPYTVQMEYRQRFTVSKQNWILGGFFYEAYKNNKITPENLYGIWEIITPGACDIPDSSYYSPSIISEPNHAWRCQEPCTQFGYDGKFDNTICGCYIGCSAGDGTTNEQGSTAAWCPNAICRTAVCSTGDTEWGMGLGLTYCCNGNWDITCANAAKQNQACKHASNYTTIPIGLTGPIQTPTEINRTFYPATVYETCEESCEMCKIEKECSPFAWKFGRPPRPTLTFNHQEGDFPVVEFDRFGEEKSYTFNGCTLYYKEQSYTGTIRETDKCCECFASIVLPNGNALDVVSPSGNCCCKTSLSSWFSSNQGYKDYASLLEHIWYKCPPPSSCSDGGGGWSMPVKFSSSSSFFEKISEISEIKSISESLISFNDILSVASSVQSNLKHKNISSVISGGLALHLAIDPQYNETVKDIDIVVDLEITENNIEKIISSFYNSEWYTNTDFLTDIQKYNKTIDFSNDVYHMYQYPLKFIHLNTGIVVDVFFDKGAFLEIPIKIKKNNYNIDISNLNRLVISRLVAHSIYTRGGELEEIRLELTKKLINSTKDQVDKEYILNYLNKYNISSDIINLFNRETASSIIKTREQVIEEFIKNSKPRR